MRINASLLDNSHNQYLTNPRRTYAEALRILNMIRPPSSQFPIVLRMSKLDHVSFFWFWISYYSYFVNSHRVLVLSRKVCYAGFELSKIEM